MPSNIPRILDPTSVSLSLHRELEPNEELYYFKGHVSKRLLPTRATKLTVQRTELGGKIRQSPINRLHTIIEYGVLDPHIIDYSDIRTPKEIMGEMEDFAVTDSKGQERGIKMTIPKILADLPVLEGEDYLLTRSTAISNQIHANRKRLNMRILANPRNLAVKYLMNNEVIPTPSDQRIKTTLSTFKDNWIVTNNKGWGNLLEIIKPIEDFIVRPWQFIAEPRIYTLANGENVTLLHSEIDGERCIFAL